MTTDEITEVVTDTAVYLLELLPLIFFLSTFKEVGSL